MIRREDIIKKCDEYNIRVRDYKFHSSQDLLNLIRIHSLNTKKCHENYKLLDAANSHMLCYPSAKLEDKGKSLLSSENWIMEPKYYGNRVFITYIKDFGIRLFSRGLKVSSLLNFDLTSFMSNSSKFMSFYSNSESVSSFLMDGIIVSDSRLRRHIYDRHMDLEGNFVSYVFSLEKRKCKEIQNLICPFKVIVFDLLSLNGVSLVNYPLIKRKEFLKNTISNINTDLLHLTGEFSHNKEENLEKLIKLGYEGAVLKNKEQKYISGRRSKDIFVKIKRSGTSMLEDVDAFISGFKDGKIEFSTYVDDCGIIREKVVGYSEFPDQHSKKLNILDFSLSSFFEENVLTPSSIGRVYSISLGNYDPMIGLFRKVKPNWKRGLRTDKNKFQCVLNRKDVHEGFIY